MVTFFPISEKIARSYGHAADIDCLQVGVWGQKLIIILRCCFDAFVPMVELDEMGTLMTSFLFHA